MTTLPDWLPPLITLEQSHGNWDEYLDAIYAAYLAEYVRKPLAFQGRPVNRKRHPEVSGKEATFWHMISEGKTEAERVPDLRRCERIRWSRAIVEHAGTPWVNGWEGQRQGEARVHLWLPAGEFLVVLAKRADYFVLWTAFPVTEEHQKRKRQREYEECPKKLKPPPFGDGFVTPSTHGG